MWRPDTLGLINRFTSGKIIEDFKEAFEGLSVMFSNLFGGGQDKQAQGHGDVSPSTAPNRSGGRGQQVDSEGYALNKDGTHVVEIVGDNSYTVSSYKDGKGNSISKGQFDRIIEEARERAGPIQGTYRGGDEKGTTVKAAASPGEAKSGHRQVS